MSAFYELLTNFWTPIRWLHVLSGAAWFGEVAVINFVLIPAVKSQARPGREYILRSIFPRVFRLASVLSATVVITGTLLVYLHTGGDWRLLTGGRWGLSILVGGGLAWIITIFHFYVESVLARRLGFDSSLSETAMADMHVKLAIIPRVAMALLTLIFVLMLFAVRGI